MGNKPPKYNQAKLKTNLQMANTRMGLLKNKRLNQNQALKQEIANYLRNGQEQLAMIKVQGYINNQNYIAALELISMFCIQCTQRIRQITESRQCPVDIRTAIQTLIWSAPRSDCNQLIEIRALFAGKYGIPFCQAANENREGMVNSIVVSKLEARIPEQEIKVVKLQEIAAEKRVDYVPRIQLSAPVVNLIPQIQPEQPQFSQGAYPNSGPGYQPPGNFNQVIPNIPGQNFPNSGPPSYPNPGQSSYPGPPHGYPQDPNSFQGYPGLGQINPGPGYPSPGYPPDASYPPHPQGNFAPHPQGNFAPPPHQPQYGVPDAPPTVSPGKAPEMPQKAPDNNSYLPPPPGPYIPPPEEDLKPPAGPTPGPAPRKDPLSSLEERFRNLKQGDGNV